jgi:putative transposase
MGRSPRIEYAGAVYHVMSRGNHQQAVFRSDKDCSLFLDALEEACGRCGWRVHAFVLMGTHYHLLLETPEPNLVAGMRWLQGTYTKRFNVRHKEWGHLFQGRYKALLVDGERGDYFSTVASYIHLNPARVKGYDFGQSDLSNFVWSSYRSYYDPLKRPEWLVTSRVLASYGFADDAAGRANYRAYIGKRVQEMALADEPWRLDEQWSKIRRGWYLGDADFRVGLVERLDGVMEDKRRDSFSGSDVRLHDERAAELIVQSALEVLCVAECDLNSMRKGAVEKQVIGWLVRNQTSVKNEWIALRLHMGNASNLSRYIRNVREATDGELLRLKSKLTK